MSTIPQSVGWWCYVPGKLTAEEFIREAADIGGENPQEEVCLFVSDARPATPATVIGRGIR